eukprot:scaffold220255_cov18-Prasinocladus_malaysianus.AAC.1
MYCVLSNWIDWLACRLVARALGAFPALASCRQVASGYPPLPRSLIANNLLAGSLDGLCAVITQGHRTRTSTSAHIARKLRYIAVFIVVRIPGPTRVFVLVFILVKAEDSLNDTGWLNPM